MFFTGYLLFHFKRAARVWLAHLSDRLKVATSQRFHSRGIASCLSHSGAEVLNIICGL
jgi:hypothetical protein